jgi:hypothetical protein
MTYQPNGVRNSVRAMPQAAHSGMLRTEPVPVSALRAPAVIARGPTTAFIELTRNIELAEQAPRRFEPTVKGDESPAPQGDAQRPPQ